MTMRLHYLPGMTGTVPHLLPEAFGENVDLEHGYHDVTAAGTPG